MARKGNGITGACQESLPEEGLQSIGVTALHRNADKLYEIQRRLAVVPSKAHSCKGVAASDETCIDGGAAARKASCRHPAAAAETADAGPYGAGKEGLRHKGSLNAARRSAAPRSQQI